MNDRLDVGDIRVVNGKSMRYVGGGLFEPVVPENLEKRFDTAGSGPLIGSGQHNVRFPEAS